MKSFIIQVEKLKKKIKKLADKQLLKRSKINKRKLISKPQAQFLDLFANVKF